MIRQQGGSIRTIDAKGLGISPTTLHKLKETGAIELLWRGVYRLKGLSDDGHSDLVRVTSRLPHGVICLESALFFHGLIDEKPESVHVAVKPTTRTPTFAQQTVTVHRFSGRSLTSGIVTHHIGGVGVQVFVAEKALADCFRFRSRVGVERCVTALRRYCQQPGANLEKVRKYAQQCHVHRVLALYIEAMSF
jgi:predicted transcriptional regulator of viral defense system